MAALEISKATGRIASTYPSLVLFQLARFFLVLATEMQAVAVGWQVYEITKRPLDLGLVGLAQFLDRKSTRLNSSHSQISYAVFCLKKKILSIQRDLNASYADVQWALAGYTLAYALVLLTGRRLGDTVFLERLFLIPVTGLNLMSVL